MPKYMHMTGRRRAAILLATLALGAVGIAARQQLDGAHLFQAVLARVKAAGVDSLSDSTLYLKAARGLVQQLNDPYAGLYSPEQLAEFSRNTLGNDYAGVGLAIENLADSTTVMTVFPHTPAATAGIEVGDRIVAIDGTAIIGWSTDRVAKRLTGPNGSSVRVTFARVGVPQPVEEQLARSVVHVPAVPYALIVGDHIGYIPLQRFGETATSETRAALGALQKAGATAYIIDLRGNPGGELVEALGVSNLFLDEGMALATVRNRGESAQRYVAHDGAVEHGMPVVVLVDANTASASEIVAGALQDHDRALVVGMPSFGKGLVQTMFPLEGGWALKMTTGRWYTPSGRSIHRVRPFAEGRFLTPDSEPTSRTPAAIRAGRPLAYSDAGRVLYGGVGIVPDVIVPQDTLSGTEQHLLTGLLSHGPAARAALYGIARDLKGSVRPDFAVRPEWRMMYEERLKSAGVAVSSALVDSAGTFVDGMIASRIADLAFGDSAAFRRDAPRDAQLQRAMVLLRQARDLPTLLTVALHTDG